MIELAMQRQQSDRANKVSVLQRMRTFVVFLDIKKAFDKVDRSLLIQALGRQICSRLTGALCDLIKGTKCGFMEEDPCKDTNVGTPQGSCLSP